MANSNTVQPTFNATLDGAYVLQLVSSQGATQSAPARLQLVVQAALAPVPGPQPLSILGPAPAPTAIRFVDIKNVLQQMDSIPVMDDQCVACHSPPGVPPAEIPPVYYTDIDRDGNGVVNANDDRWFYAEVRSRINFTYPQNSPLLRKPSGQHHFAGQLGGFDLTFAPGAPERANYDLILSWILNGAPE